MSEQEKDQEVFNQEMDMEEMTAVNGGWKDDCDSPSRENCVNWFDHPMYGGNGFPNCAATVEEGSWCGENDACKKMAVVYKGMENCRIADCSKAWR